MFTIGSTRAFYTGDPLLYTFYMGGKHGHASNSEQYSVNTERHDARETTLQSLGNRSTNTIAAICLVSRPCLVDNIGLYTTALKGNRQLLRSLISDVVSSIARLPQ